MHNSLRNTIIASAAIIGLSSVPSLAAPAGDPTAVRSASPSTAQTSPGPGMTAKIEQRISELHAKLRISAEQRPQWEEFTKVMRDNARNMDLTFQNRVRTMPAMTAADNMRSYALVSMQHAQDMQKLVPVFQALYGTMSETQRRTADQVFRDDAYGDHPRRG